MAKKEVFELKPCPFCGYSKPRVKDFVHKKFFEDATATYYVQCDVCGVRTLMDYDPLVVVQKWNKRVGDK